MTDLDKLIKQPSAEEQGIHTQDYPYQCPKCNAMTLWKMKNDKTTALICSNDYCDWEKEL